MGDRFLQTQKLYQVVDFETYLFLVIFALFTYLFYKFLLKNASEERHQNIGQHFKALWQYYIFLSISFSVFWITQQSAYSPLLPYFGFITFLIGALCFVRTSHLLVLQYLFLGSMRAGVPLLIVNIFSLLLSLVIILWTVNSIFGVNLAPLLATSAAVSIILGLALQDTLGNLFAGISLQLDKTFEIGNWLEVTNGTNKIIGQVKELSWRSTVLVGFSDELITLPNKLIAQCQIANFSPNSAILRSQTFKFPYGTDIPKTIAILEQAATQISEVCAHPPASAFVLESNENGIAVKLIYYIENYGRMYGVGDKVITVALGLLEKNNIQLARTLLKIDNAKDFYAKPGAH